MLPAACAPQPPRPAFVGAVPGAALAPEAPRARVALLFPMTGPNAALGAAMLNAAQLALFEHGNADIEFVTQDTGGTPAGAAQAARTAIADGSRIVAGPLTAAETAAAAIPARAARMPLLAMTNDAAQATPGVWPLGVTPAQQVRRVFEVGMSQGIRRFALAGPQGAFTQQLALALRAAASQQGLPQPAVVLYPGAASPMLAARDLARQLGAASEGEGPLGLILAEGGERARAFAAALPEAGLPIPPLRLLGTASWGNDSVVAAEPVLDGALYPGPDATARIRFEARYRAAFGASPPRIAAIAYDAAGLAAQAARGSDASRLGYALVPVGTVFEGADGELRLLPDGTVQRALSVYAVTPGGPARMIEPAVLPGLPAS
ncbi:amino acid/amide ABC transporter substrate-binding protein (HAAT family) [Humitalea rosea]|uniref:Amino acid/amide ABC transporter substrate-binding protein (HAAT family) n=1 Tax=Humitalea rosea TaxID=990373 RepID=A0A2W7IEL8_9PROT|nr:penicillin-binding protein activator [Humitalea rosea]PZW45098.1 amino acid/amide ABC transporter substrate-binding protein (HAAT family) [Humitalea rosea]